MKRRSKRVSSSSSRVASSTLRHCLTSELAGRSSAALYRCTPSTNWRRRWRGTQPVTERERTASKTEKQNKTGTCGGAVQILFFFSALCAFSCVCLFCECARVTACVSVCDVSVAKRPILLLPAQPSWEGSTSSSRVLLLKNKNLPVSHMSHMARRPATFSSKDIPFKPRASADTGMAAALPMRLLCFLSFFGSHVLRALRI